MCQALTVPAPEQRGCHLLADSGGASELIAVVGATSRTIEHRITDIFIVGHDAYKDPRNTDAPSLLDLEFDLCTIWQITELNSKITKVLHYSNRV